MRHTRAHPPLQRRQSSRGFVQHVPYNVENAPSTGHFAAKRFAPLTRPIEHYQLAHVVQELTCNRLIRIDRERGSQTARNRRRLKKPRISRH